MPGKRIKYEKPLLVDMRREAAPAEFEAGCYSGASYGSYCGIGSCVTMENCDNGTRAMQCVTGEEACGCSACCGTGNFVGTNGCGYIRAECTCNYGFVAGYWCASGGTNSGPQSQWCSTGTRIQNCC